MEKQKDQKAPPKTLGKAGAKPPAKKAGVLSHFVALTRGGRKIYFLPSQVTRVRMSVMQDGHQTAITDRSGTTQVAESIEKVLEALALNWVKFHRHNIQGEAREVFFVAEQVCRVREVPMPNPSERTIIVDTGGDTTVMEPIDVALRAIDNALD